MFRPISLDSLDSDVFHVEQYSGEQSPPRNNTPDILKLTELSGVLAREVFTISTVASSEPQIVTIESVSNEPTLPYGYGIQQSIIPQNFNDLNIPMIPFNVITLVFPAPKTEAQL